jgi:hypothetical protein
MVDFFANVSGRRIQRADIYAPYAGAWYADLVLDDSDGDLSGEVVITIGTLALHGTVLASASGAALGQRSLRVVAGAGGWGTPLESRAYYIESGVLALNVARDAARGAGETLADSIVFPSPVLTPHYVRRSAPASVVLERLLGAYVWWVDADGVTYGAEQRPETTPAAESYSVLTYSPLQRTATIAADDPAVVWPGAVLTNARLPEAQTVRDLELHVDGAECRIKVYTGGEAADASRLGRALSAILAQREARKLYGSYRYRVFADNGDGTANLQAVRRVPGLPDVLPVSQSAGIGRAVSSLSQGDIVRIAFDEGDPTMPYIASYAAGDPSKALGIARMGDMVSSGGPGTMVTFSVGPISTGFTSPGALGVPVDPVQPSPAVVMAGVPYLVKFGNAFDVPSDPLMLVPPMLLETPLNASTPLVGYVLSASDKGSIE